MERSLMKSAVSLITVFAICSTVYGDIAKIVEGYGKTQWGQSLETVQKAIPDGTVKQDNRQGNVMNYQVESDGQITAVRYTFLEDQLYGGRLIFDLTGRGDVRADEEGWAIINDLINKKYFSNAEDKVFLDTKKFRIDVEYGNKGQVHVNYRSFAIYYKAQKEAKQRIREEQIATDQKRLESERYKNIEQSEVNDAL